jgi:Uma2 family endonuclease
MDRSPADSERIEIVDVDAKAHKQIAAAFENFDVRYSKRAETLEMPAVMRGVTWSQYEALLDALPERYLRQAYYRGILEIRTKTFIQQRTKSVFDRCIGAVGLDLGIPMASLGSTTRTKRAIECGVEPDASYFIKNEPAARGWWHRGPEDGPLPDLVLETEMEPVCLDRLIVSAALGVAEVWKYDGTDLTFYWLAESGEYQTRPRSLSFPFLAPDDVQRFIKRLHDLDDTTLTKAFLKHARKRFAQWQSGAHDQSQSSTSKPLS